VVAYYAPDSIDWDTATPEDLEEEEVVVVVFRSVHSICSGHPMTRHSTVT
jgi:hypothetical protein